MQRNHQRTRFHILYYCHCHYYLRSQWRNHTPKFSQMTKIFDSIFVEILSEQFAVFPFAICFHFFLSNCKIHLNFCFIFEHLNDTQFTHQTVCFFGMFLWTRSQSAVCNQTKTKNMDFYTNFWIFFFSSFSLDLRDSISVVFIWHINSKRVIKRFFFDFYWNEWFGDGKLHTICQLIQLE